MLNSNNQYYICLHANESMQPRRTQLGKCNYGYISSVKYTDVFEACCFVTNRYDRYNNNKIIGYDLIYYS